MPPSTSEVEAAKELNLINNVEMKFALADTDSKLERLLGVYLAPLLLKLESQHANVRNKVRASTDVSKMLYRLAC